MPLPRKVLISLDATPYYHLISRCVRQQFLCGCDVLTGRDFSHRRSWIVSRIHELGGIFAVDVCAYAVMSNHFHLVVRVDAERAAGWTDLEVVERWEQLFAGSALARRYINGSQLPRVQAELAASCIAQWRERLVDLSWFMRCLNEPVARWANREDECTGRFWEGRFKSQALLDDAAVLTAMAYVDLNPIRAGIATTPEDSEFTSIQERIHIWLERKNVPGKALQPVEDLDVTISALLGFVDAAGESREPIPINFADFLELLDWSGRAVLEGKRGAIPDDLPPILQRLGIDAKGYVHYIRREVGGFQRVLGRLEQLREHAASLGVKFFKGHTLARQLFVSPG